MKFSKLYQFAPLAVVLFATGCASTTPKTYTLNQVDDSRCPAFRDDQAANLILEYYRPDTIYMKRPDAHEGNFLTIFTRENITTQVKTRVTQRELATVVIGYMYSTDQQAALIKDWEAVMRDCGFQRVVFLRAGRRAGKIDGLPVIHESVIAGLNEPSRLVASK